MARKRIVGNPTPRVEGEEKVTGKAAYAVDVTLPGMLWGKVLRSPFPHARIRRVDINRALELPGVKAVLTGQHVLGYRIGRRICDMPILAEDVVRFIGEKVAAVAAETEDVAAEAVKLIEVEYEELSPLLDPLEAMKPEAPLLHPDVMNYQGLPEKLEAASNLFIHMSWKKGSVEEGFYQADLVVENTFSTQVVHQAYIEPHSCVVKTDPSGGAEIWACTKDPFGLRKKVATPIGMPEEKLVVHPCHIGGDFGGKGDFMDVPLCYFLSQKSGHPVKMVMDYDEEFIAGNPRHSSIVKVRTGVKKDGRIIAHHMEFIFDSGAYAAFKPMGILGGVQASAGPYKIPHVLIEEKMIYTNKIPCGHMRAPGYMQGFFANESHLDLIARELGLDPVKVRKINLMRDGDQSPTGQVITFIRAEETLDRALTEAAYHQPKPQNVGRGIAIVQWLNNGGKGSVLLEIGLNGSITLTTGMLDQGGGAYTVMRQVVAEELEVPLDSVRVEIVDTTKIPENVGVGGSRGTRVYGNATYQATFKAKEELLKSAAEYMGATADELILAEGGVLHRRLEQRMSYGEIAKAKGSPIRVQGSYNDDSKVPEASMCAQVAEVEVDPETGEVYLRSLTTAHSTGTVLNSLMHQGQIDGSVVMGIGYALMENLVIEDGKVISANFGDFKIPTPRDIPVLKTVVSESPTGPGPYHSMSIGETANAPVAAAIANAVHDAVGVRIKSLPITAEKIFQALRIRRNEA